MTNTHTVPCPDPKCDGGTIVVHNAYAADPLQGEEQPCDICHGKGFVVVDELATAN